MPEDLEALYAQELTAIGKVVVRKSLDRVHAGLNDLLKKEERRREKAAGNRWAWDLPKFEGPLDRRRLRILSAIFTALSKRGHWGNAYESDGEIHATAIIGDTRVGLDVEVAGPVKTIRRHGRQQPSPDLPATTSLAVRIRPGQSGSAGAEWTDDKSGNVENRIAEIAARLIVAGEQAFRTGLREQEEFHEKQRLREDARKREEQEKRNRERLLKLHESGDLLRQAEEIRRLVARVRGAVAAGDTSIDASELAAWQEWALAEADRTAPVKSGQVFTHIRKIDA